MHGFVWVCMDWVVLHESAGEWLILPPTMAQCEIVGWTHHTKLISQSSMLSPQSEGGAGTRDGPLHLVRRALGPKPNDANYLTYGDFEDRSRFIGSPRESHVGIRLSF